MRFFGGTGKVSEEQVKKAKSQISKQLLGTHGIVCVAIPFNEQEAQRYVHVGLEDINPSPSKIYEIATIILNLQKEGKITAAPFVIYGAGLAHILPEKHSPAMK